MSDTASLVVRVSSQGASAARRELSSLTDTAKSAAAAVGLVVSAGAAMSKLVQTARQTDVLMASLKTMTGSSEAATAAFGELNKIAAETPYTIDQSVTAFTKLVSLGLDPSKKAIISYGNTASAMGKDLTQMIEAVADASTGEFERLKEFGIKAKQQGDQVSFTFQGVTTTVGKNAAEIEGYLQGLGENQFAGAMANRMATLDGALSNLQDSWDGLFRAVSSAGTGDIIAEQVRMASDALSELTASISSGEALAYIQAWGSEWEGTATDVRTAIEQTTKFLESKFQDWGLSADESSNLISDAFWQFPANIRAAVQVATVEIAALVDKAAIQAKKLDAYLTPSNWFDDDVDIAAYYDQQLANIDSARASSIDQFMKERDQRIVKLKEETDAAKKLRAAYDEKQKEPALDLGQFRVGGDSTKSDSTAGGDAKTNRQLEADAKRLQSQKDSAAQYLEQLRQDNMTELQLIDTQEQEKLAKVAEYRANDLISEQAHQDAINEIHKTAAQARTDIRTQEIDEYYSAMADQRKADIAMRKEDAAARQKTIDDGIDAQRNMTSDLKYVLGEQNEIYKASAIVTATIDTYKAATGAYAALAGVPVIGPYIAPIAAGAAITAGLANVAAIAGAREQGGGMRGGSAYQMAERGKAEVIVPAGASRARTAEQMRSIMGQNGVSQIQGVTIVNNTTGRVDSATTEVDNEGMLRVIIDEHVSNALMTQDSTIAKARRQTAGQPGY
jgi:hypothetical protein